MELPLGAQSPKVRCPQGRAPSTGSPMPALVAPAIPGVPWLSSSLTLTSTATASSLRASLPLLRGTWIGGLRPCPLQHDLISAGLLLPRSHSREGRVTGMGLSLPTQQQLTALDGRLSLWADTRRDFQASVFGEIPEESAREGPRPE